MEDDTVGEGESMITSTGIWSGEKPKEKPKAVKKRVLFCVCGKAGVGWDGLPSYKADHEHWFIPQSCSHKGPNDTGPVCGIPAVHCYKPRHGRAGVVRFYCNPCFEIEHEFCRICDKATFIRDRKTTPVVWENVCDHCVNSKKLEKVFRSIPLGAFAHMCATAEKLSKPTQKDKDDPAWKPYKCKSCGEKHRDPRKDSAFSMLHFIRHCYGEAGFAGELARAQAQVLVNRTTKQKLVLQKREERTLMFLKRLPKPADYSVVRRRRIAKAMAKIVHAHRATYRNVSSGVGLSEDARFLGTLEIALDLEYGYTKLSSPGPVKRPDTRT